MRAFWKSFVYFLDNSRAFFSCTTTFHLCIISCSRTHWSWAMTILTHFWPRYQITTLGKSFIFWHTWIMDHWKSELKNRKQLMNAHWNFFTNFFFLNWESSDIIIMALERVSDSVFNDDWLFPLRFSTCGIFGMADKVSHFNSDISRALYKTIGGNLGSNLRKSELPFCHYKLRDILQEIL